MMNPHAPFVVEANKPDITICNLCDEHLTGRTEAIKHLRAIHGITLQDAIEKTKVLPRL